MRLHCAFAAGVRAVAQMQDGDAWDLLKGLSGILHAICTSLAAFRKAEHARRSGARQEEEEDSEEDSEEEEGGRLSAAATAERHELLEAAFVDLRDAFDARFASKIKR